MRNGHGSSHGEVVEMEKSDFEFLNIYWKSTLVGGLGGTKGTKDHPELLSYPVVAMN